MPGSGKEIEWDPPPLAREREANQVATAVIDVEGKVSGPPPLHRQSLQSESEGGDLPSMRKIILRMSPAGPLQVSSSQHPVAPCPSFPWAIILRPLPKHLVPHHLATLLDVLLCLMPNKDPHCRLHNINTNINRIAIFLIRKVHHPPLELRPQPLALLPPALRSHTIRTGCHGPGPAP